MDKNFRIKNKVLTITQMFMLLLYFFNDSHYNEIEFLTFSTKSYSFNFVKYHI
jgi:hypothetical protein